MKIHTLGNYRPLCHTPWGLLAYKREKLFLIHEQTLHISEVCDLPIIDKRRPFCFCDFGERLAHITAYCGISTDSGAVIAFNRGIYHVDIPHRTISREFDFIPKDMRRPLNFYKIQNVNGFQDMVVFADYSFNKDRKEMHIWGRDAHGTWKKQYTFPAGQIRHIHSIINDPYRDRVLVLTGDLDHESAVWECKDQFSHIRRLTPASQLFRACCAHAFEEGVMIITDSPFDQNYIYLITEDGGTLDIKKIRELPGPVVFFNQYKDQCLFATDVEYDERTVTGFRQYVSYKRGPGVLDWYSHLFIGSINKGFTEQARFKKDIFPMVTLGFGNVHFPNGEASDKIFFYPTAVKKYDQTLCYFDMNEDTST